MQALRWIGKSILGMEVLDSSSRLYWIHTTKRCILPRIKTNWEGHCIALMSSKYNRFVVAQTLRQIKGNWTWIKCCQVQALPFPCLVLWLNSRKHQCHLRNTSHAEYHIFNKINLSVILFNTIHFNLIVACLACMCLHRLLCHPHQSCHCIFLAWQPPPPS